MSETNPFFINLAKSAQESSALEALRICNKGLFISEDYINSLTKHYQDWIKSQTGKEIQKSTDKYLKKFFDSETPKASYLIDGKKCLVGYLANETDNIWNELKPSESKVSRYQGELLDPEWFLHPKDPIFSKLPDIDFEFDSSKGSSVCFKLGGQAKNKEVKSKGAKSKEIKIDSASLNQLVKQLRAIKSPALKKHTLRDSLLPILAILNQAKAGRNSSIVPSEVIKKSPSLLLRSKSINIVLDQDNYIIGALNNSGKEFRQNLEKEILALQTKAPLTSIRSFTASKSIKKIRAHGMSLKLSPSFLMQFIKLLIRKKTKKGDKRFLSVKDVINKLVSLIHKSKEPSKELLKDLLKGRKQGNSIYKVNGKWVFVIKDKSELVTCFRIKDKKPKKANSTPLAESPQHQSSQIQAEG